MRGRGAARVLRSRHARVKPQDPFRRGRSGSCILDPRPASEVRTSRRAGPSPSHVPSSDHLGLSMNDIASWVAPAATMIAAIMTAANLGARVTGWGFVVFSVGSVAWTLVGLGSGQTNLVATNIFLTLVNLVGI